MPVLTFTRTATRSAVQRQADPHPGQRLHHGVEEPHDLQTRPLPGDRGFIRALLGGHPLSSHRPEPTSSRNYMAAASRNVAPRAQIRRQHRRPHEIGYVVATWTSTRPGRRHPRPHPGHHHRRTGTVGHWHGPRAPTSTGPETTTPNWSLPRSRTSSTPGCRACSPAFATYATDRPPYMPSWTVFLAATVPSYPVRRYYSWGFQVDHIQRRFGGSLTGQAEIIIHEATWLGRGYNVIILDAIRDSVSDVHRLLGGHPPPSASPPASPTRPTTTPTGAEPTPPATSPSSTRQPGSGATP